MRSRRMNNLHLRRSAVDRFAKAANGTISIFLVIVLVPVISVAGLFVDASRYELAKSEVAAAADLTLNATMANYDTILKDVYGLFAVSQNDPDALHENLKSYFVDMVIDAGLADNEAEVEADETLSSIVEAGSGGSSSLLQMTMDDEDSFTLQGVENSSLAEPDVLKNEIVEYSKYRTPLNAAMSILDGVKGIANISKQSSIAQKSTEVDENIQDLNKACKTLYKHASAYQDGDKDTGQYSAQTAQTTSDSLAGFPMRARSVYLKGIGAAIQKRVLDSVDTIDIAFSSSTKGPLGAKVTSYVSSVCSKNLGSKSINDIRRANAEKLLKEFDETDSDSVLYWLIKGDGLRLSSTLSSESFDSLELPDKVTYIESFNKFMAHIAYLHEAVTTYCSGLTKDEKTDFEKDDAAASIKRVMNKAKGIADQNPSFDIDSAEIDTKLQGIDSEFTGLLETMKTLQGKAEACCKSANAIKKAIEKVHKANAAFKQKIDDYDTSDEFSAQMESQYQSNEETIKEEDYLDLLRHFEELEKYFNGCVKHLGDMRFFGSYVKAHTYVSVDAFARKIGTTVGKDDGSKALDTLINEALDRFGDLTNATALPDANVDFSVKNEPFYKYLKATFDESASKDEGKTAEANRDSISKAATEKTKTTTETKGLNEKSIQELTGALPSSGGEKGSIETGLNDKKSYSGMLTNMTSVTEEITSGIKAAFVGMRDNLYVTDYAFSMFSWYSQKAEYGDNVPLQTSTGIAINDTNNQFNRAEIEYIMYGKDTPAQNVNTAKTQVFAIRFVSNALHALTDSEIKSETFAVASVISAASAGVIPPKIPQVVLQLALALGESAIDLHTMIDDGDAVPFKKDASTWHLSVKGGINYALNETAETATKTIKGALNKLVDTTTDGVVTATNELTDDLGSVANSQMQSAVNAAFSKFSESITSSLSKLTQKVYLESGTSAEEIITQAKSAAQEYINQQEGVAHDALQSVYDAFLSKYAGELQKTIETNIQKIESGEAAGDIVSNLQKTIDKKISGAVNDAVTEAQTLIRGHLSSFADELKKEIGETIDDASEAVRKKAADKINTWFGDTFGGYTGYTAPSNGSSTGYASMLKFKYSDYLKIILYIKLCANSDDQVERIGDLIQVNIGQGLLDTKASPAGITHAKGTAFSLSKAYTYYELNVDVGLQTMFISLPFITEKMGVEGKSAFELSYHGAQGY